MIMIHETPRSFYPSCLRALVELPDTLSGHLAFCPLLRYSGRAARQQPRRSPPRQEAPPRKPRAATFERLLEKVEGQRRDERAAGEGQRCREQGLWRPPVGADDRTDYQGAGRGEAEEDGRQYAVRLLPMGTS